VIQETLIGILMGIINGLMIAALGYGKNHTVEDFDPEKFFKTCIFGIVVGGLAGSMGVSYDQALTWLGQTGLIVILQWAGTMIWRWIKPVKPET